VPRFFVILFSKKSIEEAKTISRYYFLENYINIKQSKVMPLFLKKVA